MPKSAFEVGGIVRLNSRLLARYNEAKRPLPLKALVPDADYQVVEVRPSPTVRPESHPQELAVSRDNILIGIPGFQRTIPEWFSGFWFSPVSS